MEFELDNMISIFYTEGQELIVLKQGKLFSIEGISKKYFLSYFNGEINYKVLLDKSPELTQWFINKRDTVTADYAPKITLHPDFIILSKDNICHECILRWLPRYKKLDQYINYFSGSEAEIIQIAKPTIQDMNWDENETKKLLEENSIYIADYENNIFSYKNSPLQHPECLTVHKAVSKHLFNLGMLPVTNLSDVTFQMTSEDQIPSGLFHETTIINAPSLVAPNILLAGRGVDSDRKTAQLKSVVEAVERFHSWKLPRHEIHYGSGNDFSGRIIDMKHTFLFSPEQYADVPFKKYDPRDERWWVNAINLTHQLRNLIPLDFIELNSSSDIPLYNQSSSGMAAHTEKNKSIEAGLLEVLERSGQYEFWINGKAEKVNWRTIKGNQEVESLLSEIGIIGINIHIWTVNVKSNLPQIALCALEWGEGKFVFSSACNLSLIDAIKRAVTEAYTEYINAKELIKENNIRIPTKIVQPVDHLIFYLSPNEDAYSYIKRFLIMRESKFMNKKWSYKNIISELKNNDMDVIVIDKGSSLSDYLGVFVHHIFIPQLPSLGFSYSTLRLPNINYGSYEYNFFQSIPHPFG